MKLTWSQQAALSHIAAGNADLRRISEPTRQRVIDLGMMEPPLVDVDADRIYITPAGRRALATTRQTEGADK